MKYQVYFGIAIRIIILFSIGMLWTFINPALRDFFDDHQCKSIAINEYTKRPYFNCENSAFSVDEGWIWGARHYWYWWMMFLLFCLSLINIVLGIIRVVDKHYP